jgi:hypothetical protein
MGDADADTAACSGDDRDLAIKDVDSLCHAVILCHLVVSVPREVADA